jgi:hypothetical protein
MGERCWFDRKRENERRENAREGASAEAVLGLMSE